MIDARPNPQMPPKKIALIIDGECVEMLHADERLAAIFLSEPTIVDVTEEFTGETFVGKTYSPETGFSA